MGSFTEVKQFGQSAPYCLGWDLRKGSLQGFEVNVPLNWESGFFSDGSFLLEVNTHEGVQSWEEVFEVDADEFVCVGSNLFLQLQLVDMEFFEAADDRVEGTGMVHLLQHWQVVAKPLTLPFELSSALENELKEWLPESWQSFLKHEHIVGEVYIEAIDWDNHIDEPIYNDLRRGWFFDAFEVLQRTGLQGAQVEFKQLLEFGPEKHIHWVEIVFQGGTTSVAQNLFVLLVDCQDEQDGVHIVSVVDGILEVFQEELDAGPKNGPKDLNCPFRTQIKELCSEDNFMDDSIH